MHNPPAPVFHDRNMSVLAPHQPRRIEQSNGNSRYQNQIDQGLSALLLQHRPKGTHNQGDPKQKTDRQIDLPEAPKVHIFISLMSEPKIRSQIAEEAMHRRPFSGEGSNDNDEQADE